MLCRYVTDLAESKRDQHTPAPHRGLHFPAELQPTSTSLPLASCKKMRHKMDLFQLFGLHLPANGHLKKSEIKKESANIPLSVLHCLLPLDMQRASNVYVYVHGQEYSS